MDSRIPVVDLQTVGIWNEDAPSDATWRKVGEELARAFADIGFAYITNHGVPEEVVQQAFGSTGEFFALTENKKNTIARQVYQGYVAVNREKLSGDASHHELRESYDVNDPKGRFPDSLVPTFRPSVCALMDMLVALNIRLLQAMEWGLGVESGVLVDSHKRIFQKDNGTALRILNYPPVPEDAPENTIRCGAHTDYGTVTILLQDTMGGLEVRDRGGQWVAATPISGALLLNVGDLLQMWTNDAFIATEHRVLVPAAEHLLRQPRRSMAFFVHPDDEVVLTPLDGSQGATPPVTAKQHLENRFAATYQY